jgi:hypothetical protein
MLLVGPNYYDLTIEPPGYRVAAAGRRGFRSTCCGTDYKLYVILLAGSFAYVGVTKQKMADRFRLGWRAAGESGYYGYTWRHQASAGRLLVWSLPSGAVDDPKRFIETVEAEVVYLVRQEGQWPLFQTEIHFHTSEAEHRELAGHVFQICRAAA